jgi:tetratricopeptide (TPR) repeat protein
MPRLRVFLFSAAVSLLLSSCFGGSPDLPVLTEQQAAAVQWNNQGHAAFKDGDYAQALAAYRKALEINRSTEDVDGIAMELVNISTVYDRLGDRTSSLNALDQILVPSGIPITPTRKAEAAYRKAVYFLEDGDDAQASAWSDKALVLCQNTGCPVEGRLFNLKARMALGKNPAAAITHAHHALVLNRSTGDKIEEANSLRLIADASLQSKDFATAQQFFDDALRLDKEAGSAAKIALDLMGLGRSLARQGRSVEAQEYFRRAYSVFESINDVRNMRAAEDMMKESVK